MTGLQSMFQGCMGRSVKASLAVLLLTSGHHAYGGLLYGTPWRLHMVGVAAVTTGVLLASLRVLRASRGGWRGELAFAVLTLTTLAVPVGMIGAFEGLYNHVLKDVLYFGGAPTNLLSQLFPPPTYELPNDVLFELTGVLQPVPAGLALLALVRAFRERWTSGPGRANRNVAEVR
ncbi:hypothetical protein FJV41_09300 [Myxococcus llanfairpwllgwyngyllgogerychwyrndrobwllllantysiliogogogochensis]|uniref:Uncharacterized protein n=1 Tax=Myxococcus llanfairpwllgwyngyllgogerychwyrndrobwllllantysiliogogogochensis TaxID=2590453 RepID=A0A540X649_9BACT|nr:hypothetical protein [Myxococcus llanfairpwllgwyngyllgogerychwyrndrobwllllantysiliogogogochensis]TQF16204.1 hypothetical protein FJV41_09300 [Myxococcus llanfairpwllgwyngyllgogerychwyrndrobwllllantysiliogogogochensis]